jgi:phosphotransferase system enzyme I (PtsI)
VEISLKGIGVSPGIAIGPVLPFGVRTLDIPKYEVKDTKTELQRFDKACDEVRAQLARLQAKVLSEIGEGHGEIFTAHMLMLDDIAIREEIEKRLEDEKVNVEYLVDELIGRYSKIMTSLDDDSFRERAKDIIDVGNRILGELLHAEYESIEKLDRPSVIVARDLSPSETANMDVKNTLAIATDLGGPTSHTAILARAFEVPAVVGLRLAGSHASAGDTIVVDGTRGCIVIRPNEKTLKRYEERKDSEDEARQALLVAEQDRQSITLDGVSVPVLANIELPVELMHSKRVNAQGVGLYRTEYLFMNRLSLPNEQEQYEAYSKVAQAIKPAPVTLRTLDLGGDKFSEGLPGFTETNPQLGWRAIRLCLEMPDVFKAQLRAMLRASVHGDVQIMFPLISGVDEFLRVKEIVREVCGDLEREGVPFKKDVKLGSMIEVPAAVIVANDLARECDFFSLGTNDLIQYSLAVDRVNERVAHMYEPAHPAVLRMIWQTAQAAKAAGIPCSICGEMAGDPLFTPLFVGFGVDSLSMSAVAIPEVRACVAATCASDAQVLAQRVLTCATTREVLRILEQPKRRKAAAGAPRQNA